MGIFEGCKTIRRYVETDAGVYGTSTLCGGGFKGTNCVSSCHSYYDWYEPPEPIICKYVCAYCGNVRKDEDCSCKGCGAHEIKKT